MILPDAVKKFQSKFKTVTSKLNDRSELDQVCSGGTVKSTDVLPALYSTPERAVEAWLYQATLQHKPSHAILEWQFEPELKEFQITIADRIGQHRLVANRFAVKSQFTTSQ